MLGLLNAYDFVADLLAVLLDGGGVLSMRYNLCKLLSKYAIAYNVFELHIFWNENKVTKCKYA